MLYRIEDPYKVMTTIGPGRLYEDALVIPRDASRSCGSALGELDAEEFYNGDKRATRAMERRRRSWTRSWSPRASG